MTTTADLLARAVDDHQAGRLPEAGSLYRHVLDVAPADSNALHLLGLVTWRTGDPMGGAALIRRAVAVFPKYEAHHINLGNLYRTIGDEEAAIEAFEHGVRLVPDSLALREMFCGLTQDRAVLAIKSGDLDAATVWATRCAVRLIDAPRLNRSLYDMLERQIQIALITGRHEQALAAARLKNRYDFPQLPESELDVFTVRLLGFSEWCAQTRTLAEIRTAAFQPVPETLHEDYPEYLHLYLDALPELGNTPVGVARGVDIEVIQGFYVKDNYESFVIFNREALLHENEKSVVRSGIVPLVGVTPDLDGGLIRLPRPDYRRLELAEPHIFVPSTPNYWHFMVEVLPQLMLCDDLTGTTDLPIALFDVRGYQFEMFDLAGIARDRVVDLRERVGRDTKQVLYRFRQATVPSRVPYPVAYRLLRERLLTKARSDRGPLPRRVFLSRRGSYPKHRISNDTEIGNLLTRHGFTVVLPETLSVLETIELIAQAEMVVAPIGAGTSNHVFLPPYGTWIHLNNPDFFHPDSPWNSQMGTQATLVGTFRHLTGRFVGDPAEFPERLVDRLEIPIEIDPAALERLVEEAEARLHRRTI